MTATTSQPTFTLYRGWPTPNQLVWSPFVTKVELRLRHASLPVTYLAGSTSASPKGKIPYITVAYSPTHTDTFSDSTLIIDRLVQEAHLPDLNTRLSPEQRLADYAIRALLEEKLYFMNMRERWVDNYHAHRDHILGHLATPVRAVVGLLIYRTVTATLHGQGTGRFSDEELEAGRLEIWRRIEDQLVASRKVADGVDGGDEPFWILGGTEPTEADMSLFGFVSSALVARSGPKSRDLVRGLPAVIDYANRIFTRYFAGYEHWD